MDERSPAVVLVDDEASLIRVLARALAYAGLRVRSFTSARRALASIEQEPPEVLVTDLRMPEMDGVELAREVRARLGGRIGIVLCSGTPDLVARADRALFDAVVRKPFELDVLLAAMQATTAGLEPRRVRSGTIERSDAIEQSGEIEQSEELERVEVGRPSSGHRHR